MTKNASMAEEAAPIRDRLFVSKSIEGRGVPLSNKILLRTNAGKFYLVHVTQEIAEAASPEQELLILLHKILEGQGHGPRKKVQDAIALPANILARFGLKIEPMDTMPAAFLNLEHTTLLPYAAPGRRRG